MMSNHHNIQDERRQVSVFSLTVLQAVIDEQIKAKQLHRDVGSYIYQAVKDQATRKDWIE